MYARVARFEGAEADGVRAVTEQINANKDDGPPEGVLAVGLLRLQDPDNGRSLDIVLFETEEDRQTGDETLSEMTPQVDGGGDRTSVEFYEVGVDIRL